MARRLRHRMLAAILAATLAPLTAAAPAAAAPAAAAAAAAAIVYEAEDGLLAGVVAASDTPGYSGSGYVAGFDEAADQVTVTVAGGAGGLYDLAVVYRSPFGDKQTRLLLNGAPTGDLVLPGSETFTSVPAGRVLLRAGDNTVTLQSNWGWYEIDALRLTPAPAPPPHQVSGALVNPDASAEARSLMTYLADNYGRTIVSGQQDMASIQWLETNVGKAPAIAGLDMMDYSPSRVERGATSHAVDEALAWDARGGITTFVWHWNAPSGLVDQPGKEWWRGFYTDATTFDLAAALADPDGDDYRLLLRDIDAIAVQLKRLQDARVPVLWRPLHEAEGGWFWWGAKGPGPAKQLWRLMYDRLTHHHGLNNLIWVWNSAGAGWYPGDDVVDLLSVDSYPQAGDHGAVSATYDRLRDLGRDRKVVGLSEVGSIPDPDLTAAYHADWSYFVTWGGGFLTDGQSNSLDFLRKVYTDPRVITLDELGDVKHWPRTGAIQTATGKCVATNSKTDGAPIFLADCIGGGAQTWTVRSDGTLRALGKCLDIKSTAATGWGTKRGTRVQLWDCWGGPMQRWVAQSDGSLRNPHSGRCLDVPGGNTRPGTRLRIWDCNHLPAQVFRLP
jgi:glycosyl hydrolase family 26/carbohydrate binding protein with CBM35 domain/ricin-type beta-trefoil lectin protein